jgi:hypothetical protein
MERTAEQAARKVARLLDSRLALLSTEEIAAVPEPPKGAIPFDWGRLGRSGGRRAAKDIDISALAAETSAKARRRLADCALAEPNLQCVQALIQLARVHPYAQRALLKVLAEPRIKTRHGYTPRPRLEAFRFSTTFRGAALAEAKQAWLQVLANDFSKVLGFREDPTLLERIADYVVRYPDVPNLDLALNRCARPSARGEGPTDACLRVLGTVPPPRRIMLLYPYLTQEPQDRDALGRWVRAFRTTVAGVRAIHPQLAKLCRRKAQRSRFKTVRSRCAKALASHTRPTPDLAKFFIDELMNGSLSEEDINDISKIERRLCPGLKEALGHYRSAGKAAVTRRLSPSLLRHCR